MESNAIDIKSEIINIDTLEYKGLECIVASLKYNVGMKILDGSAFRTLTLCKNATFQQYSSALEKAFIPKITYIQSKDYRFVLRNETSFYGQNINVNIVDSYEVLRSDYIVSKDLPDISTFEIIDSNF